MFGDFADPVFQHTAARRRLEAYSAKLAEVSAVSTHSRPKAAGKSTLAFRRDWLVSTHSRPKAAGPCSDLGAILRRVSTHSRPKEAG